MANSSVRIAQRGTKNNPTLILPVSYRLAGSNECWIHSDYKPQKEEI